MQKFNFTMLVNTFLCLKNAWFLWYESLNFWGNIYCYWYSRWLSGKKSAYQCRRHRRHRFNPWVGKIPWSRKCQPAPVFLPEKFQGQKSLAGYHPWGRDESDTTECLSTHTLCSRRSARSQDAVTRKEVKPTEKMDWPVIKLPWGVVNVWSY